MVQIAVSSSMIDSAHYDKGNGTLTITFRDGTIYTYHGVPPSVIQSFTSAGSKGKFFAERIRGNYSHTKVG